jgi:hypothetical protein
VVMTQTSELRNARRVEGECEWVARMCKRDNATPATITEIESRARRVATVVVNVFAVAAMFLSSWL